MTAPMPAHVAAWIRDIVLTAAMLKGYGPQDRCPCTYEICHHCRTGHTTRCVVVAWGGAPRVICEGWITDRRGRVVPGCPDVWRAGRACRWICACKDCPVLPERPPVGAAPVVMQLDIFGELAGAL